MASAFFAPPATLSSVATRPSGMEDFRAQQRRVVALYDDGSYELKTHDMILPAVPRKLDRHLDGHTRHKGESYAILPIASSSSRESCTGTNVPGSPIK